MARSVGISVYREIYAFCHTIVGTTKRVLDVDGKIFARYRYFVLGRATNQHSLVLVTYTIRINVKIITI